MSDLKAVITAYRDLSFSDRGVFCSTVSNEVDVREETLQYLLIANNRRKREETLGLLFGHMLCAGITVRNKDISARSALPILEV